VDSKYVHKRTFALDNDIVSCSPFVRSCLTIPFDTEVSEAVVRDVATASLPVIEAYTRRGLILRQSSHPRPTVASFPEIKFSMKTSDCLINRCSISSPAGDLKSTVIDRLLRFIDRKYADSGGKWEASTGALSGNGAAGGFQDPGELR